MTVEALQRQSRPTPSDPGGYVTVSADARMLFDRMTAELKSIAPAFGNYTTQAVHDEAIVTLEKAAAPYRQSGRRCGGKPRNSPIEIASTHGIC